METKGITKNIIIIIAAVLIALIGYGIFIGGESKKEESLLQQAASEDSQGGREILTLLLNLKSLKLDSSIFSKPSFKGLINFGQELPVYPQGRDNPFAPIEVN